MAGGIGGAAEVLRRGAYAFTEAARQLIEALRRQSDRWVLWSAPAFGAGIAFYFALAKEPHPWKGISAFVILTTAAVLVGRHGHRAAVILALLAACAGGFATAQVRTVLVAAPVLKRDVGPTRAEGRVVEVEPNGTSWRLTLADLRIKRLEEDDVPARVRVRVHRLAGVQLGDLVGGTVKLLPPPAPVLPGGFDFARQAWFDGLGGVGFAYGPLQVIEPAVGEWRERIGGVLARTRLAVAERLTTGVGGASGGVAAALATGHRGAVPQETTDAYRDSGLAHMLSISGLHMTLAAGLVFATLRALLALLPGTAQRHDIKKIAAVFAIASMTVYLGLSGAQVPAQRAYVMGIVIFIAVLFDRSPLTLRTLTLAACVVMLLRPEAVVEPGFQMSFAAVAALIAAWETLAPRLAQWRAREDGPLSPSVKTAMLYIGGAMATTAIAGLATAPYGAFHFHAVAVYSTAANLLAMPVMSFWIMPWLVLALALMPFGLDGLTWVPLRLGLDVVEAIGSEVSAWPGAVLAVPPIPAGVLALTTIGGLWLCLWRGGIRWLGLPLLFVGGLVPWFISGPDMIVSGDGGLSAVRSGAGIVLSPGRKDGFARGVWQETWGRGEGVWTGGGLSGADPAKAVELRCDGLGCLYRTNGRIAALVRHEAALAEDCAAADVVVASVPVRPWNCDAPLLIDFFRLRRDGTHAITFEDDGTTTVQSVRAARGDRPWSAGPLR